MEQKLSKEQVIQILDNRPKNVSPEQVLNGLVQRGFQIEGLEMPQNRSRLGVQEAVSETKENIQSSLENRLQNTQEISSSDESGFRKSLQKFGQGAGLASDILGQVTVGAGKAVLPQRVEQKIEGAVQKVGETVAQVPAVQNIVAKYQELQQTNPALARDIDAALGVGSLALDLATLGAGTEVVQQTAKQTVKAVSRGAKAVGKTVGGVVEDVVPSTQRIVNSQVTKALDLTQGDVKNIAKSTGNEAGNFLADKNLIANTKEETLDLLNAFWKKRREKVLEEVGKVSKTYIKADVPRAEQALKAIRSEIGEIPGLETVQKQVDSLLGKEEYTLADIQNIKELMDDHLGLYKITGDVKAGATKEGLSNIRKELRQFIEKEVQDNTGVDIKTLNNEVQTARNIENATIERSTRGLTRSNIKLGDLGVFGAASTVGTPLFGLAAVAAKKIIESPSIRLRLAKYLDKVSDTKKLKIQKALEQGEVPKEVSTILDSQQQ